MKTSSFPCGPLPRRTKAKLEKIFSWCPNQRDSSIDPRAPSCFGVFFVLFCFGFFGWRQISGFGSFIAFEVGAVRVMDSWRRGIRFHSMKISAAL